MRATLQPTKSAESQQIYSYMRVSSRERQMQTDTQMQTNIRMHRQTNRQNKR